MVWGTPLVRFATCAQVSMPCTTPQTASSRGGSRPPLIIAPCLRVPTPNVTPICSAIFVWLTTVSSRHTQAHHTTTVAIGYISHCISMWPNNTCCQINTRTQMTTMSTTTNFSDLIISDIRTDEHSTEHKCILTDALPFCNPTVIWTHHGYDATEYNSQKNQHVNII